MTAHKTYSDQEIDGARRFWRENSELMIKLGSGELGIAWISLLNIFKRFNSEEGKSIPYPLCGQGC